MDSPTPSWVQPRPGQRQEANDCFLFEIPFLDPFPFPRSRSRFRFHYHYLFLNLCLMHFRS